MFLSRIFLTMLALLVILKVATPIPLTEITHRHIISDTKEIETSPEAKAFKPDALLHDVPDDFFVKPSISDAPSVELDERNKFGLWPSGPTVPEKTVLLNHGEAKFEATFTLVLREGEELKGMRHRPNDTTIITSFEESRERHVEHYVSYNITITHHFKGTVGVAEYELAIFTTMGATLRVTGKYYVAGIVVYASTDSRPLRIVSGITSPPLSVETMYSFAHTLRNGHVMLPLKFQHVGPDISWKPASLEDVLSTAEITVASMPLGDVPILDARKCNMTQKKASIRPKGTSDWEKCDVGFEYDSRSLVLRLHPERYGKAIIDISFPKIRANGETYKTDIRLKVSNPAIRRPELIMTEDVHLDFDYYGTESFSLQVKNMRTSVHRREVVSYVLDLPEGRYATADFSSSSLLGRVQNITFTVVVPGQENKMVQHEIQHALKDLAYSSGGYKEEKAALVNIRRLEHRANQSHLLQDHRRRTEPSLVPFSLHSFGFNGDEYFENFDVISISRTEKKAYGYRSHVHAVFPSFNVLLTANNSSGSVLWTSFASKKLAVVEMLRVWTDRQNLLVKFILLRYTISSFSQYKSMQISKYLSKEVSKLCGTKIQPATLVTLEDRGLNVEATYHVLVPQKYTDSVTELNRNKKNISRNIANHILLKDGRVKTSEIVRLAVLGRPTVVNITESQSPTRYKGANGTLVVVIVVLAVIIAIPLLTICIGCIFARRYRGQDSSDLDNDSGRGEKRKDDKKSREDPQAASGVLRDNYGRADDKDSYESFKVRTDMSKQGYFGSDTCSGKEKKISHDKS